MRDAERLSGDESATVGALLAAAGASKVEDLLTEPGHYADHEVRVPDRPALVALLVALGMARDEAARAAADARWGIVLEPGGAGAGDGALGASRLGGRPVLPAQTPWPRHGERPLTHLATLALDELPPVEGRDVLPAGGHLAFFADLTEAGEFWEPLGPDDPRADLRAERWDRVTAWPSSC